MSRFQIGDVVRVTGKVYEKSWGVGTATVVKLRENERCSVHVEHPEHRKGAFFPENLKLVHREHQVGDVVEWRREGEMHPGVMRQWSDGRPLTVTSIPLPGGDYVYASNSDGIRGLFDAENLFTIKKTKETTMTFNTGDRVKIKGKTDKPGAATGTVVGIVDREVRVVFDGDTQSDTWHETQLEPLFELTGEQVEALLSHDTDAISPVLNSLRERLHPKTKVELTVTFMVAKDQATPTAEEVQNALAAAALPVTAVAS